MNARAAALGLTLFLGGCAESAPTTTTTQADTRGGRGPDYELFSQRCSKCHALSRALQAHISEDAGWVRVVTRMRQKPESGISDRDATAILRYLHLLAEQERANQPPPPPAPSP